MSRIGAAAPDAITASVFLALWLVPLAFGARGVGNGMLVMLVEFVLIHATILVPAAIIVLSLRFAGPHKALLATGVLIVVYLLFLAALSATFHAWWPCLAFTWLLLAKFGLRLPGERLADEQQIDEGAIWTRSMLAYLGGLFAFTVLPIPQLGFASIDTSALVLPSHARGIWMREPYRVIAFGTFYFYFLAWTKWRLVATGKNSEPQRSPRAERDT